MSTIKKSHIQICQALDSAMTKDFLQKFLVPVAMSVLKKHKTALVKAGYNEVIPSRISTKTKLDTLEVVAVLFSGVEAYKYFREALHEEVLILWDALVFNGVIGFKQAQEEYGITTYDSDVRMTHYYNRVPEVNKPFEVLPRAMSSWGYQISESAFFFLPKPMRAVLVEYYQVPDEAQLTPMQNLPKQGTAYSDSDAQFFSEYARLQIYYKQGEIKYTAKFRPLSTGLPKVQRMVKIKEFFPDTTIKRHKLVRTQILTSVMPYLAALEEKHSEPHHVLRAFFNTIYISSFPSPPAILPDIKGLANLENREFEPIGGPMFKLLKELPPNSYISTVSLLGYCKYNLVSMDAIRRYDAYSRLTFDDNTKLGLDHIDFSLYKSIVNVPLIKGSFFLFAALGLCELIFEAVDAEDFGIDQFSPWDGLIAVKRTPLGDYVCGLTDEYKLTAQKNSGFTLSEEALIIKLDSADSPYTSTLGIFAEQISPMSFKTDHGIFLQNINRKEELKAKIELFKQMAAGNIPKNWEDFLNDLYKKINPLSLYGDCTIFSVPQDNQELIRLLAQDPVIKTLILKAEGFLIIVPKKNYPALRRRLAEFGYLQT